MCRVQSVEDRSPFHGLFWSRDENEGATFRGRAQGKARKAPRAHNIKKPHSQAPVCAGWAPESYGFFSVATWAGASPPHRGPDPSRSTLPEEIILTLQGSARCDLPAPSGRIACTCSVLMSAWLLRIRSVTSQRRSAACPPSALPLALPVT